MRTKGLRILILFLCVFSFICCDKEHEENRKVTDDKEYVLTVASKKIPGVLVSDGNNFVSDVYAVKKEQSNEWIAFGYIEEFEFEKGYEYKIKISETSYLDYSMGQPAWTERKLLEVISKDIKKGGREKYNDSILFATLPSRRNFSIFAGQPQKTLLMT